MTFQMFTEFSIIVDSRQSNKLDILICLTLTFLGLISLGLLNIIASHAMPSYIILSAVHWLDLLVHLLKSLFYTLILYYGGMHILRYIRGIILIQHLSLLEISLPSCCLPFCIYTVHFLKHVF